MFRLLSQLFSFIGNVIYLLSYPFLWVIGILLFVILRIGLYPIISWMLASWFFILNHYYGFNSEIAIPWADEYRPHCRINNRSCFCSSSNYEKTSRCLA